MHESAYEVAGNDPRQVKLLRASLQKLSDGPDATLKEMAAGVLRGDLDLRQATMSDAYGPALGAALDRFCRYYDDLDKAERDKLVATGKRQLDELVDGPS